MSNEENNLNAVKLNKIKNLREKINKNSKKQNELSLTVEDIHEENIDKKIRLC